MATAPWNPLHPMSLLILPYQLHLVPCPLPPLDPPIAICAINDYFRAVWKASDKIDFDAGIGGRNEGNAESRRMGHQKRNRVTRKSQTRTYAHRISLEFESRGKPRVPRMVVQEGSCGLHSERIAARETQRSRVGLDLPLNSIRRSGF